MNHILKQDDSDNDKEQQQQQQQQQLRQQQPRQIQIQQQQFYDNDHENTVTTTPIIRNDNNTITSTSLSGSGISSKNNTTFLHMDTTSKNIITPIILRNTTTTTTSNKYARTSTSTGNNLNQNNDINNNNKYDYRNSKDIESETPTINNRNKYYNDSRNSNSKSISAQTGTCTNDTTTRTITPTTPTTPTTITTTATQTNNNNNNNRQIAKFAAKINNKHTTTTGTSTTRSIKNSTTKNTNWKSSNNSNKTTTTTTTTTTIPTNSTNSIQSIRNVLQQQQQQQQQMLQKGVQNNNSDNVVNNTTGSTTSTNNNSQPVDFDISIDDFDFDISTLLCDNMEEEDDDYNHNNSKTNNNNTTTTTTRIQQYPNEKEEEQQQQIDNGTNTINTSSKSILVDFDISDNNDIDFDLSSYMTTTTTTGTQQYDNDCNNNNNNTCDNSNILIVQDISAAAAAAVAAVTKTNKNNNNQIEEEEQQQQHKTGIASSSYKPVLSSRTTTGSPGCGQCDSSNDNNNSIPLVYQEIQKGTIIVSPVVSINQPTIFVNDNNDNDTNTSIVVRVIEASPVSMNYSTCSSIIRGDFDNVENTSGTTTRTTTVVKDINATPVSPLYINQGGDGNKVIATTIPTTTIPKTPRRVVAALDNTIPVSSVSINSASSIVSGEFNPNDIATTISSITPTTTAATNTKETPATITPVLPVVANKITSGDYRKRDTTTIVPSVIKSRKTRSATAASEIGNDTKRINRYDSTSESSTEVNLDDNNDNDSDIDNIMINNNTKKCNANALQWQQQHQLMMQLQQPEEKDPLPSILHQQRQQQEEATEEPKPYMQQSFEKRQQRQEHMRQEVVQNQSRQQQQQQQQQLHGKVHDTSQSLSQRNVLHSQEHEKHLHVPVLPQHLRPMESYQKQQQHNINQLQTLQQQQQPHEQLNIDRQKVNHLQQHKETKNVSFPSYESHDSNDLWYPEPIQIIEANCFDSIHEEKQEEDHIEYNQSSSFTGRGKNNYHTDSNSINDEDDDNNYNNNNSNEPNIIVETSTIASAETHRISSLRNMKKRTTITSIVAPSNWMSKNGRLFFRRNRSIMQPDDKHNSNSSNQHINVPDLEMSSDDDVHISGSKVSTSGQSKQYNIDNNDKDANYLESLYKHNRLQLLLIISILLLIPLIMTVIFISIIYRSNANMTSNSASIAEYELLRYQDSANSIVQTVQSKLLMLRQSMESLAYQTAYYGGVSVSLPGNSSSRWPFVTVENFQNQSQYVQTIAEYPIVFFNPIVTSAITRRTWEIYALPKIATEQTPLPFNQIWGRIANRTVSTTANTTSSVMVNPEAVSPNYTYGPIPKDSIGPFHPIYQIYEGNVRRLFQTRRVLENGLRDSSTNSKHSSIRRSQQQVSGNSSMILFDMMTATGYQQFFTNVIQQYNRGFISDLQSLELYRIKYNVGIFEPLSLVTEPISPTIDNRTSTSSPIVGTINTILQWKSLFIDILRTEQVPVHSYIQNTCGDQFTYTITGPSVTFDGYSPKDHFANYTDIAITTSLHDQSDPLFVENGNISTSFCLYTMTIYPLARNSSINDSNSGNSQENKALTVMLGAGLPLLLLVLAWIMYDYCAYNRNIKNIHPGSKRLDQLLVPVNTASVNMNFANSRQEQSPIINLKEFMQRKMTEESSISLTDNIPREPLADHYANATILSASLVGFYAWASEFEPSKVFLFLEELQRSFETIAKSRRICIVDSFVGETSSCIAVSGILGQDTEHAITMIRFARDMLQQTIPFDTGQSLRLGTRLKIGIHSGSITAGVIRQDREHRLRLFGDVVAIASSLEQSGDVDKIHCGIETAIALASTGKGHWAIQRAEQILVTDKELMQTFWIELSANEALEETVYSERAITTRQPTGHISEKITNNEKKDNTYPPSEFPDDSSQQSTKTKRLVDWNVHILKKLLNNIVSSKIETDIKEGGKINAWLEGSYAFETLPLEEIQDYIKFPPIEEGNITPAKVMLSESVAAQLHDYITNIALLYNENPYHNFEHASHAVLSVSNLFSKLYPSESSPYINRIVADPLTQFACILAALIRNADHPGVSNEQLNKEGESITEYYCGKSTAEQNSIDLCWDLLLKESYSELRSVLCKSNSELRRFRGLLLNTVLGTDLWNFELAKIRNSRWNAIFYRNNDDERTPDELELECNQKCTALVETIIQSADIAHTMQDWNVYLKWNQKSFEECYVAYRSGRAEDLPSLTWYTNELDFFEGVVIPIAQKLKDSYAFGLHGESFVHSAIMNRDRWAIEGNDIVRTMLEHLVLNDSVEVIDFQPSYDERTNTTTEIDYLKGRLSSSSTTSNHLVPDDDKTNSVVSVRSVWSYHAAKADARAAALARRK